MSLLGAAPTLKQEQDMINVMPAEFLTEEIRRASQKKTFYSLHERIKHEAYIARLKIRLAELGDPRIQKIMVALRDIHLGLQSENEKQKLKTKMQALPSDDMDELFFVFEHAGAERIVDILRPTYEGYKSGTFDV
jgi:hypothetical protein